MSAVLPVAAEPPTRPSARRRGAGRRLLRKPLAVTALAVIALVALASVLAPLLTANSPTATRLADTLAPMSAAHPLGADGIGGDVLAQLLYGGRTSLWGALITVSTTLVLGVPAGVLAGYYRGWFDALAGWVSNALMALPVIIVLLVVLARVGRSTALAMAVFGVLISPAVFRIVRTSVSAVREELYVDAARVAGLSDLRIMRRHVLPVVLAPVVITASQLTGAGIVVQAGLEFLGLGSSGQASWGGMLNDAAQNIYTKPSLLLWPGAAIVVTVMAFSLLGGELRDVLQGAPAARRRRAVAPRAVAAPPTTATTATTATTPTTPTTPTTGTSSPTAVPDDALLVVRDLRVSYPRPDGSRVDVVEGVDLVVHRGEVLGLVGESGSGKSQTAFSVLGLLPPEAVVTAAASAFDGRDLLGRSPSQRNALRGKRIGYIPQEPMSNLDPAFRIGHQLTQPLRHHLGLSRSQARAEVLRLLARVGIPDPERTFAAYPHEVSGGMAQRVLIAGAVSCDPDLLIADEPTTALDVTVQAEVLDLLRSLQEERGMAVVLVTHDFGVVADLCDTVAVMRSGRVVETAPVRQLFADPRHEYTRTLLASTLEGTAPRARPAGTTPHPTTTTPNPTQEAHR